MAPALPDVPTIHASLHAFLVDELLDPEVKVSDHCELASLGVDSFALMEVLLYVERAWGVALPMEQLTPDNTRTLAALSDCVARVMLSERVA